MVSEAELTCFLHDRGDGPSLSTELTVRSGFRHQFLTSSVRRFDTEIFTCCSQKAVNYFLQSTSDHSCNTGSELISSIEYRFKNLNA